MATQGLFSNLPGSPAEQTAAGGRLIRVTPILTTQEFTPHPSTRVLVVEACGGSGAAGARVSGGGGGGGGGSTCFPAGTLVRLASGALVPIELVRIGDRVLGRYGRPEAVEALDRPLLGDRTLWLVNGRLATTAEHRFWSAGAFACIDPGAQKAEWEQDVLLLFEDGERRVRKPALAHTGLNRLEIGSVVLAEGDLDEEIESIEALPRADWPPETPLFNLVVGGSHMFFAGGFLVSGFARDDDFDYHAWGPRGAAPAETASAEAASAETAPAEAASAEAAPAETAPAETAPAPPRRRRRLVER